MVYIEIDKISNDPLCHSKTMDDEAEGVREARGILTV